MSASLYLLHFRLGRRLLLAALLFQLARPAGTWAQTVTACVPATGDAARLLHDAARAAGIEARGPTPLGLRVSEMVTQDFQSDRSYPPYSFDGRSAQLWYYPDRGVEFTSGEVVDPFGVRPLPPLWSTARGSWLARDSLLRPMPSAHRLSYVDRPLNAWAVLADWIADGGARVTRRCVVRDFPRLELTRRGIEGDEQLYLDPGTALPIMYRRTETDVMRLWGARTVAYIYSNWFEVGGGQYPMGSFRLVDGESAVIRTVALQSGDAPAVPALADTADMRLVEAWPNTAPDTVRVSQRTWLLRTRMYTNVVTLARDTVFILDAQWTGEARARQDSSWIARLFPGRHPVVLVVSDLAWPHISGVRSWVAMGATVVAHRSAVPFLTRVIERRWRGTPDLLEQRRRTARVRLVAVDDSLTLGGGAIRVVPINGIGSEGALMSWLPGDCFLYAGDYVQGFDGPSLTYVREVFRAVQRERLAPERLAAMHLPLTPWQTLVAALSPASGDPPAAAAPAGSR